MSHTLEQLTSIAIFVRVFELRSFSAAAESLGISKSHASACVARLESQLGARLIHRTTRRVIPSEEGHALYQSCAQLLKAAESAASSTHDRATEPIGTVRLAAPLGYAHRHVLPLLGEFLRANPKLQVEICATDAVLDLLNDRIDVALRFSNDLAAGLVARKVGTDARVLCGAPNYLSAQGTPRHPRELAAHRCLHHTHTPLADEWRFSVDGVEQSVPVAISFAASDATTVRDAALAGMGLAVLPAGVVDRELDTGALMALLPEFALAPQSLYLVYAERQQLPHRVRLVVDFLARELAKMVQARGGAPARAARVRGTA